MITKLKELEALLPYDPYTQQLNRGFRSLQFTGLLEGQFRETYVEKTLPRVRIALYVALALLVLFSAIDWVILPELRRASLAIRFGVMMPFVLLALWMSYQTRQLTRLPPVMLLAALGVGWSALGLGVFAATQEIKVFFPGLVLTTIYVYSFLALRFRLALTTGALILAGYVVIASRANMPNEIFFYNVLFLVAANAIGAAGNYALEHSVRLSFLESRILEELVNRDGLTGIHNRRTMDDHLDRVWRQMAREAKPVMIMLVDVDYFKDYNDTYGHGAGDECLKQVAATIADSARRPLDLAARYGGEEFAVLLAAPEYRFALVAGDRLCDAVRELEIPHRNSRVAKHVTVSIGATYVFPGRGNITQKEALEYADRALYEAKDQGRDRVVFLQPRSEEGSVPLEGAA